jgi:predicted deacetylase
LSILLPSAQYRPAQYLLRIDDLCPTMAAQSWREWVALIEEFRLRPILAVVPENGDPALNCSPPDPGFWTRMRAMQAAGAAIALHGLRHACASKGRSVAGFGRPSEFAGVSEATQREWIRRGLEILRGQGLDPKLWVAPRHGFDDRTLRVLRTEGICALSDGLARVPFVRGGLVWIPQQLWAPVEKAAGLWTICVHPNTARAEDLLAMRAFLHVHAPQFTSVDRVLEEFRPSRLGPVEAIYASAALWRMRLAQARKRLS